VRVKQRTKIFCDMCGKEIPPKEEKQISSVSIEVEFPMNEERVTANVTAKDVCKDCMNSMRFYAVCNSEDELAINQKELSKVKNIKKFITRLFKSEVDQ
jgi:hypothetical protein